MNVQTQWQHDSPRSPGTGAVRLPRSALRRRRSQRHWRQLRYRALAETTQQIATWNGSHACKTADGLAPPFAELQKPGWPTALTILAVTAAARNLCEPSAISTRFDLDRATQWLIAAVGKPLERSPEYGHDGRLIGWPWVVGTHSWQEPTAWSVLALKAIGLADHPRTREGVTLLVDRLLDIGGCNYGNTVVLGQRLRPHIEPTGITLVALAGETIDDPRIERSCNYLESAITAETPPISLSYGLLGLTAQGRPPANLDERLETAYRNTVRRDPSPLALALLVLAAQESNCPLIEFTKA